MASALSRRTRQAQPQLRLDRAQETFRHRARQLSVWAGLALLFAAPLLFLSVWASEQGFTSPALDWIARRAHTATLGPGFTHLQYVYPPLPVLLSLALPGNALSLAVVTSLFAGVTLAIILYHAGPLRTAVLAAPLVFVPAMWYMASQLLPQVVALTFLALALQGFLRFAADGETYGGFIAGLALAVSYSADPGALVYAAVMAAFVPLLGFARYRGDPQAPVGVAAVILFPCIAMAACWSFLIWKFTGGWPGNLAYAPNAHVLQFPLGVLGGLAHALASALRDLAHAVLYIVAAVLLGLRRGTALIGIGLALPVLALAVALWLGFDYSPVTAYFMFTLLSITVIMRHRLMDTTAGFLAVLAASAAQLIVANTWVPVSPGFTVWQQLMFR